jgi:predicted component of type VI protein secretion system
MPLTVEIVSEHRDLVGDDCVREYHEEGGTIGRALENDWILPDPDRYISGRHATIDYKGGIYYLADTSSNGVYMNGEIEPIGKGNPRRLFDGDHMRMGDFEFEVRIDKGESLIMPLDLEPSVAPDNIEQFVDEDELETGVQLLDENEITGDDEFQSVLFGDGEEREKPEPVPEPEPEAQPAPVVESANDDSTDGLNQSADVTADDLFDSFLDGLGISRMELHPSVSRPEMMVTAGLVLREFVDSTIKLLSSRANLKNSFRLDQTTVFPRQNNPMKFSDNTDDLIKQLLVGGEGEYLGARDAVREASRDLVNHQNALLEAMNAAFMEFTDRFDPDELEDGFNRTLNSKLFAFMNRSKYWGLYRDLYPAMTEKGSGRFPQIFSEEFVKAYEGRVAEYRRHDREGAGAAAKSATTDQPVTPDLLQTQKLEGPAVARPASNDAALEKRDFVDASDGNLARQIRRDQPGS